MINQQYTDIVTEELLENTLDHNAYTGFLEDYRVLSCLLKIYNPKKVFEIGTNVGSGVNVIKTALPESTVFSLDLDYETMRLNSKQYPLESTGEDRVGSASKFDFVQLRGDSMKFPYQNFPCDAYFVDGEHDKAHPLHETKEIIKLKPKLIVWHDADMPPVYEAIVEAFIGDKDYSLYRVEHTRIAYAIRNNL